MVYVQGAQAPEHQGSAEPGAGLGHNDARLVIEVLRGRLVGKPAEK